jgi:hypothetical protein
MAPATRGSEVEEPRLKPLWLLDVRWLGQRRPCSFRTRVSNRGPDDPRFPWQLELCRCSAGTSTRASQGRGRRTPGGPPGPPRQSGRRPARPGRWAPRAPGPGRRTSARRCQVCHVDRRASIASSTRAEAPATRRHSRSRPRHGWGTKPGDHRGDVSPAADHFDGLCPQGCWRYLARCAASGVSKVASGLTSATRAASADVHGRRGSLRPTH